MKVEISLLSWHVKVYKWFYHTHSVPVSLCKYFWKTAFATIIAPFLLLLSLPNFVIIHYFKGWRWFIHQVDRVSPKHFAFAGALLYGAAWIFTHTIFFILALIQHHHITTNQTVSFAMTVVSTIMIIVIFVANKFYNYKTDQENRLYTQFRRANPELGWREFYEESKKRKWYRRFNLPNSLLVKAIIAWYNKSCPIIEWTR